MAQACFLRRKKMKTAQKNKVLKCRGLPQGAPTSPQLANLAGKRMDLRLSGLADSLGLCDFAFADCLVDELLGRLELALEDDK